MTRILGFDVSWRVAGSAAEAGVAGAACWALAEERKVVDVNVIATATVIENSFRGRDIVMTSSPRSHGRLAQRLPGDGQRSCNRRNCTDRADGCQRLMN